VLSAAEAAEAAAAAAYGMELDVAAAAATNGDGDELDLAAASSSRMVHFQDDTEWVDTEFSFGGTGQQQQQHAERHLQQEQQQHAYTQQQQQHEAEEGEMDGTMSQPFVKSLFNKAASAAAASGSGNSRVGSAGRNRQQAAARSAAAAASPQRSAAAALGDIVGVVDGVQLLAVPADQVARWQQLEASMPDMQKDKERLRKMRVDLERAATRLEQERAAWEKQKVGEGVAVSAYTRSCSSSVHSKVARRDCVQINDNPMRAFLRTCLSAPTVPFLLLLFLLLLLLLAGKCSGVTRDMAQRGSAPPSA
jgi:hypothetical protein